MRVIVLGAGAGGGLPQWNCGCERCTAARADLSLQRTQTSLAVSVDDRNWFLINAAPDLRQQLNATPRLHPPSGQLRGSPVAGVILTNAEVDAVTGLLAMREGQPFAIYAHPQVLAILQSNSIFNVLDAAKVPRIPLALEQAFEPRLPDGSPSGLEVTAFAVPGKGAWYLEGVNHPTWTEGEGDCIGLRIASKADGRAFFVIAGSASVPDDLKRRIAGAELVFFDGTLWRDDEMIRAGMGAKTGRRMGHISMGGPDGTIAELANLGIRRKVFVHINNSNPVWLAGSPERDQVMAAGWEILADGREVVL